MKSVDGTLDLSRFVQPKIKVSTEAGPLYVRHLAVGDVGRLKEQLDNKSSDLEKGEIVLTTLTNDKESLEDISPLEPAIRNSLNAADLLRLCGAIAAKCNLGELDADEPLREVGKKLPERLDHDIKNLRETSESVTKSVNDGFSGILGEATRHKLSTTMTGLAGLKAWLDAGGAHTKRRVFVRQEEGVPQGELLGVPPEASSELTELREIKGITTELSREIVALSETLILDVLPEWLGQVDEARANAQKTLSQAKNSVIWATITLAVSVAVALAIGWWQVDVARRLSAEAGNDQQATMSVLKEQLAAQKELLKQLRDDNEALQAAIAKNELSLSHATAKK